MLLQNVCIVGEQDTNPKDIFLEDGMISSVRDSKTKSSKSQITPAIHFENAIAFPGLINSHDHLDFNLFPQLGNRIYHSYREWGVDIHQQNKTEIEKVLAIPQSLRIKWGMYKNLLNGFTTVVNHGDYLDIEAPFIDIFQNANTLHSVGFEKKWKWKLNKPVSNQFPYVIHSGEGTDLISHKEIDVLIKWNLFKKTLVAVHGVAMDSSQAKAFKALVWCPASNYFLLGKTAEIDILRKNITVVFGSDSTLSADWNIWNHLRMARKSRLFSDKELLGSLTDIPAKVWNMFNKGYIRQGASADLIIARNNGTLGLADSFFQLNPEDILLVVKNGEIKMFDHCLSEQIRTLFHSSASFSAVAIQQSIKQVTGNLPELINKIRHYYPDIKLPFSIPSSNH